MSESNASGSHVEQQATYSLLLHPQLADVYGNVFCMRLGRDKTVFVTGWKMVKEAIVTQADNFVDRPYIPMVTRIYSGNSGDSCKSITYTVCQKLCFILLPCHCLSNIIWFICASAGLFFSNGKVWKRQRRFAMATLRTFGLANSSIEHSICEESHYLQESMEKERGRHIQCKRAKYHNKN